MSLAVDAAGLPQVLLLDEEQRPRYQLTMNDKGAPGMMFLGADHAICSGQGTDADGEPWRIDRPLCAPLEPRPATKPEPTGNGGRDGDR
ncbi:MAG: hypothetical protein AB7T19_20115 [Planctomycetota bacterium]